MNNFAVMTLVYWETPSKRRQSRAGQWAKDFGLNFLTTSLAVGELYKKERAQLQQKLTKLLSGKRDKYYIFMFCKSCFRGASLGKYPWKIPTVHPSFELVRIEKSAK